MDNETIPIIVPFNDAPYTISDTDKAGLIFVVTTFCLICVWILFCIRIYIRKTHGPWKWDDTCVAAATSLTTTRSAIVYLEISRGYGKTSEILSELAAVSIGKAVYGDNVLYFIAMFFSKCAVLLLCQRMTPKREHRIVLIAIFGFSLLWAIVSILLVSINCNPGHSWVDLAAQCSGIASRWRAICALDVTTELSIFACSIYLVYGLHMSWYLKGIVILAFGIRVPTTIFSGIHLSAILTEISSSDPILQGAITAVWKQLELDFAICACTLSSLGAFLKPFDKQMGPSRSETENHYAINTQRSFHMSSLNASATRDGEAPVNHGNTSSATSNSFSLPILRPDAQANIQTTVFNGSNSDTMSVQSNDSKKGIIMKQVMWTVENGARNSGGEGGLKQQ